MTASPSPASSPSPNADMPPMPLVRGHYSQLVVLPCGTYHMAGQKAWDPATGVLIAGTLPQQVEQIFANIRAILANHRLDLGSISRISCHLADIHAYDLFNEAYTACLGDHRPARIVLGGYQLRDGALIELGTEGHVELRA